MTPGEQFQSVTSWELFEVTAQDLQFLYNVLLEKERPEDIETLASALITSRIEEEQHALQAANTDRGRIYRPADSYEVGERVLFPLLDWRSGQVVGVRSGHNPELPEFSVIDVQMDGSETHSFAAALPDHKLNNAPLPTAPGQGQPLSATEVVAKYGTSVRAALEEALSKSPELVRFGGKWFLRALLADIGPGQLNLAEAALEVAQGGPLTTAEILDQIEIPGKENRDLLEFSMATAMLEDGRFDEVGQPGSPLWFLERMEPEAVRSKPAQLVCDAKLGDDQRVAELEAELDPEVQDELEPALSHPTGDEVALALIYPHWRLGTIPLTDAVLQLLGATADVSKGKSLVSVIDENSGERFLVWLLPQQRYLYGLADWYSMNGLIPGSIIRLRAGRTTGELRMSANPRRPTREWIKTVLTNAGDSIEINLQRYSLSTEVDERMAYFVADADAEDLVWSTWQEHRTLEQAIRFVARELVKLSPQAQIHLLEIYAGVNLLRRCPPGAVIATLLDSSWASYLGDLYFRFGLPDEASQ
jgi:hypothetical protein